MSDLEERLRKAFRHVLYLGSRDADTSKWYAEELAKIAVREFDDEQRSRDGACDE